MSWKLRFVQNGALAMMGVLLLAISQTAAAQEAKPQETKGLSVDSKDVLGIAPQIPELKGYVLRIRKMTMEPGGVIAHHTHANRPTVSCHANERLCCGERLPPPTTRCHLAV